MLKSQTCLFLWTVWIWVHGLPACMWLRRKKKKKDSKPTKMQICIKWLQSREWWCNISVTEHSRNNIFRIISVSKRNSSLITFVKICLSTYILRFIYLFSVSLWDLFSATDMARKELKQQNSTAKVQIDCHCLTLLYSLSGTKKISPFNI